MASSVKEKDIKKLRDAGYLAKEILNGAQSLGIKLPQVKRLAFARLDLANQHNLCYHNQTEISIKEILNAALQYRHVLGWTPAQSSANP